MADTSIQSVQQEIAETLDKILASENLIGQYIIARDTELASVKSYANTVRTESGICQWKSIGQDSMVSGTNLVKGSSISIGSGYTLPGRVHAVKRGSGGDCGWKADELWKRIDLAQIAENEITGERKILAKEKQHLEEMETIHQGLIETGESFVDLQGSVTKHKLQIEKLNVEKALVTKARAESGMPIVLISLLAVVVVVAIIIILKKKK